MYKTFEYSIVNNPLTNKIHILLFGDVEDKIKMNLLLEECALFYGTNPIPIITNKFVKTRRMTYYEMTKFLIFNPKYDILIGIMQIVKNIFS